MGKLFLTSKYFLCLVSSLVLNFLLLRHIYYVGENNNCNKNNIIYGDEQQLSWSSRAAKEAEAVAAVNCSGHGRAFLDSFLVDGKPSCECNTCYGGHDCSQFFPDCPADVDSGNPLFLEPYWMKNAASSAVVFSGWHRMSYVYSDQTFDSKELEKVIRKVHAVVGNAITDDRFIVFGDGSTQLLNAAVHAFSSNKPSTSSRVVASIPYYPVYKAQTEFFDSLEFQFQGDTWMWSNKTANASIDFIEFVTSPNNPDGMLKKPILQGSSVKTIYDHAYYWPYFSAITAPADGDLMIFSVSKLTGHASSRFGWALVKDEAIYERMIRYMKLNTMGASRDTQLRALKLLNVILQDDGKEIFQFGYETMRDRWLKLSEALLKSKRLSIQEIPPLYCNFFKKVRGPSPAFAWLKCEREEDTDCYEILKTSANIIGRNGSLFSAESSYVRLSLIKSQDDFDLLLQRINTFVAGEEVHSAKAM